MAKFNKDVPPGHEKEINNIAIDFDGVIHTFDKGFHDGTCYGDPIKGAEEALKKITSNEKKVICCFGSLYSAGNILNKN